MMRRAYGLGAVMIALCVSPAMAQTVTPSGSTATNNSTTNVVVPQQTVPLTSAGQIATDPAGYSPYHTGQDVYYHGQIRQVPSISAPTVYGLNPCSVGASVGVATPVVGLSGAITTTDKACEARNNAALAISAFHNEILARELTCSIENFRDSWKRIGKPCLIDQPTPVAANSPMGTAPAPLPAPGGSSTPAVMTPVPVPSAPVIITAPHAAAEGRQLTASAAARVPAFCKVPGLAVHLYPECHA